MNNNAKTDHQGRTDDGRGFSGVAISAHSPLVGINQPLVVAQAGITLIELMAVLVVAAILMGIAIPAIGDFIRNSRMITQTNEFVANLAFARSEAIKRAANVVICKSTDPTAASPVCDAGDDWSSGWLVFVDDKTVNNAVDANENVVRAHARLDGNNTLFAGATIGNLVTFTRTGLSTLASRDSFVLCDQRGASRGRSITLEVTGRPTLSRNPSSCDPS